MLLALGACAGLTPPQADAPRIEMPARWSAADAAGGGSAGDMSLVQWWRRFDDAALAALVGEALQANTRIESARAALQQARALRDVAQAGLAPTLDGSASARQATAGGHSTGHSLGVGLDAAWAPDVFGARRAAIRASQATADASAATLGDVQVQLAAEVALNYITLRSTQRRLAIAEANLASQEETLQITQWRQQAGLLTTLDTEQARAAAEQNRALLPALRSSIVQTRQALAVLSGQPPAALTVFTQPLDRRAAVPAVGSALALDIPAATLRQRADVRAAEFQVAAALAQVGQAEAQRWPSFSIGGSIGLNALNLAALTNGASVVGSLLASVSLPVFDGGALRAQVRVQQAALAQAQQTYRAAVLGALQEVEAALLALRSDRLRLASLTLAAGAADNAAQLARQRYASGLTDFQTVLETQRTLFATQDGVASATANVSSDHVRLFTALGGGWQFTAGSGPVAERSNPR